MTEVARGTIHIEVNDREALARLGQIEREYERTMADIDRSEATATVDADIGPLLDEAKRARREVKRLEGLKAEIALGLREGDAAQLNKDLKVARANVKSLDGMVAEVEIEVKGEEEALKAQERIRKATEKRIAAEEKREAARQRVMDQLARREAQNEAARLRAIDTEANRRAKLNLQREREMARAHSDAMQMERDRERAAQQLQREIDAVPKLQRRYAELQRTLENLTTTRRKARGDREAELLVDLSITDVENDMQILRRRLEAVGREPITVPVNLQPGRDAGQRVRNWFAANQGPLVTIAAALGADIGSHMGRGAASRFRNVMAVGVGETMRDFGRAVGSRTGNLLLRAGSRTTNFLSNLSNMTVRLGPFTATIRQAIAAGSLFAPILFDIAGALGALIGVMGSATVGLGALSAGFLGGFIPAALGFGLVIKGVASEFANVMKAQKAYDDALRKGNTDLAKTKLEELRAVMGNVSKETVKNIGLARQIGKSWRESTGEARESVWNVIGQGLKTADTLMGNFASRTNEGMKIAETATTRWLKALQSGQGQAVLDNMMSNFNEALGPLLDGLGNIVAYLGKVGSLASNRIPAMARQFENWSERVLDTADNMSDLDQRVGNVIDSTRTVGRFFMSFGRFTKAFFGAGEGGGRTLLDAMAESMDGWTQSIQSTDSMAEFFDEAVAGARQLWNFLRPIASAFSAWATAMSPVARGFFAVGEAVGDLINGFLQLTGLRGPVTAFLTTLGVLWGLSKIRAATTALTGFTTALLGLSAAQSRVAASQGVGALAGGIAARNVAMSRAMTVGAGSQLFAATMGANAARSAGQISRVTKAANVGKSALAGLGAATLGVSSAFAGAAVGAAAAGYGIYRFATRTRDAEKAERAANEAYKESAQAQRVLEDTSVQLAYSYLSQKSATQGVKAAEKEIAALRKDGKKGTDDYKMALLNLRQARLDEHAAQEATIRLNREETALNKRQVDAARRDYEHRRDQLEGMKNLEDQYRYAKEKADAKGMSMREYLTDDNIRGDELLEDLVKYQDALDATARAEKRLQEATDLAGLTMLNQERAMKGLIPIANSAARAFAQVRRLGGAKLEQRIGIKFDDPKQAARVAEQAARSLRAGVPKNITARIIGDSKSAEDAIKRLQRAKITPKRLEIVQRGGQEAIRVIENIIARKLTTKEQRIAEKGGDAALRMLQRILGVRLPNKAFSVNLRDNASSRLAAIRAQMDSIRSKTVTITSHYVQSGSRPGKIIRDAQGGMHLERKQDRAAQTAALSGAMPFRSGKTRGPRYLVGEETQFPEFVISTNPRDRDRNRRFAAAAARAVGLDVQEPIRAALGGAFSGAGFFMSGDQGTPPPYTGAKALRKGVTKKKKGAKERIYKQRRSWSGRVEALLQRQDFLDREVSLRDQAVREPRDFVVEDGRQEVKGPDGKAILDESGQPVTVPKYKENPDVRSQYIPDLQKVQEAFQWLLNTIQELVTSALPNAIQSIDLERWARGDTLNKQINPALKDARRKERNAKSGSKTQKKWATEVRRLEKAKAKEERIRDELGEDRKTYVDQSYDSGFDFRQALLDKSEIDNEINETLGNAPIDAGQGKYVDEAARMTQDELTNAAGGGGAGGGAAGGGISYAQQLANLDSAKMEVLRTFGGNFSSVGAVANAIQTGGARMASSVESLTRTGADSGTTAGGILGAASITTSTSAGAAVATSPTVSAPAPTTATAPVDSSTTVAITNNFDAPPPDPHVWSRGVEFEMAAVAG
jgi:hypothetical protein